MIVNFAAIANGPDSHHRRRLLRVDGNPRRVRRAQQPCDAPATGSRRSRFEERQVLQAQCVRHVMDEVVRVRDERKRSPQARATVARRQPQQPLLVVSTHDGCTDLANDIKNPRLSDRVQRGRPPNHVVTPRNKRDAIKESAELVGASCVSDDDCSRAGGWHQGCVETLERPHPTLSQTSQRNCCQAAPKTSTKMYPDRLLAYSPWTECDCRAHIISPLLGDLATRARSCLRDANELVILA